MSRGGLLSYYGTEEDDYHLPNKHAQKSRSQRYDELTQNLKTGNSEYGLHYPEGTPRDHYLNTDQDDNSYDLLSGHLKPRAGKSKGDSGTNTPNFGRRRLITNPKSVGAAHISDTRSLGAAESPPLLPRRHRDGLPKISSEKNFSTKAASNSNYRSTEYKADNDFGYRDVQKAYLSSKTADTVKLSDIAQIDLVLTLNDKTKVVVKAAPFKPFNF